MKNKRRLIGIILLLAYIALVCYLCFGKFDDIHDVPKMLFGFPIDKIVHFVMFFPAPFLLWLAFGDICKKPWQTLLFILVAFALGCLAAAGTEVGQSFTKYRTADIMDFRADTISIAISSVITLLIDQILHLYKKC